MKLFLFLRSRRSKSELMLMLKRIVGQKLVGVSQDKDSTIQLHFDDWVVFVRNPFPSPIIERVPYETGGSR